MATHLFVYSGSGNSLWVAHRLAEALTDEVTFSPMKSSEKENESLQRVDRIGFIFPVHAFGVPRRVRKLAEAIELPKEAYCFAVALHAGQVARSIIELNEILSKRGFSLKSGFELKTPGNYTPLGGPGAPEKVVALLNSARKRLNEDIAPAINARQERPLDKGNLFQCLVLSRGIHSLLSDAQLGRMGKRFFTDERCTRCGLCVRLCPARNVRLTHEGVRFGGHCEQCFACLQWCPKEAIQCSKKSHKTPRYRNPQIELSEFLSFFENEIEIQNN